MAGKIVVQFDEQLLGHIKSGRNDEAKSMISADLVQAHDYFRTLLHYAVRWDTAVVARHLIELGSEVDAIGVEGRTPLISAVFRYRPKTVKVLLEANAHLDITSFDGNSALRLVLFEPYYSSSMIEPFLQGVRNRMSSTEELIEILYQAGSSLYHAAHLKDVQVMEALLERGFHIDSEGRLQMTALHGAAEVDDLQMAKWLVEKGADVNALDEYGNGPLSIAASRCNQHLVQFLLEQGADPNTVDARHGCTPLFGVMIANNANLGTTAEGPCVRDCVELLLQHGAVPRNAQLRFTLFDHALRTRSFDVIDCLIARLAILDPSVAESVMRCDDEENRKMLPAFEERLESCRQLLTASVDENLSLLDLLTTDEDQMKNYVRKEAIARQIEYLCLELSERCPYYARTLTKWLNKAFDALKLEEAAIVALCELINEDYNQCYVFARKVIDYLCKQDLERLCQAGDYSL